MGAMCLTCGILLCLPLFCSSDSWGQTVTTAAPENLPATIGTWTQIAKLTTRDGAKNDQLGFFVSASGNTLVVGAPYAKIGSHEGQGAVYVFVKPAGGWAQVGKAAAKLTASDGAVNATFGFSVAISDDTVVVGADSANLGSKQYAGAAYVFVKPATGWADATQTAKLTASDSEGTAYFGSSVSISGDTVVVGADGARVGSNPYQGAAYIFVRPANAWKDMSQTAKLTAADGMRGSQLGYSASISHDTVAVGARSATVAAHARQGAAYVFVKPAGGWENMTQTAELTASEGMVDDQFGSSVSISGDQVAVGAPGSGSAYVFVKPATGWAPTSKFNARLTASDRAQNTQLGWAVSVNGDRVAVGARSAPIAANSRQGAAYIFVKPAGGWENMTETAKLTASDGQSNDELGASVLVSVDAVVVGAPGAALGPNKYEGAVYVFGSSAASAGSAQEPAAHANLVVIHSDAAPVTEH